jgi:hypothetical protein
MNALDYKASGAEFTGILRRSLQTGVFDCKDLGGPKAKA